MTTRAIVASIVAAVAIVGTAGVASVAREPRGTGICVSAAGRGCPMMGPVMMSPAVQGGRSPAPESVGPSPDSPHQAQPGPGSAEVGRQVYLARCTACHSPDPGRNGPVGPAVKGATLDLVRARVLRAAYPSSYVPKRPTRIMPPQPDLAPWIADLAAFLGKP
jgi:mono/diheme cytochrome c family protein